IVRVDPQDRGRTVSEQVQENIRRIVGTLLEDRSTTKILLTDAVGVDPAFDRKLQSFYEVVENLLVDSLREGQELGIVAPGDARMFAFLMMGVLKEILYQVVRRDAPYTEDEVATGTPRRGRGGWSPGAPRTKPAELRPMSPQPSPLVRSSIRHRGGRGEPLLLLHGFSACAETWRPVIPALERNHDVFAVTFHGHMGGEPIPAGFDHSIRASVDLAE